MPPERKVSIRSAHRRGRLERVSVYPRQSDFSRGFCYQIVIFIVLFLYKNSTQFIKTIYFLYFQNICRTIRLIYGIFLPFADMLTAAFTDSRGYRRFLEGEGVFQKEFSAPAVRILKASPPHQAPRNVHSAGSTSFHYNIDRSFLRPETHYPRSYCSLPGRSSQTHAQSHI